MGGMTGSLLLLLWAGVSVSTVVDLQKRIFNGHDCRDDERQYHVKLNIKTRKGGTGLCGGSLISGQWILTAGRCWNKKDDTEIKAILRVRPSGQKVPDIIHESNIRQHPTADIMLLRLTKARPDLDHIHLPNCVTHPPPRNVMVQIAGHGATTASLNRTKNPRVVQHLKCANITAIDCPSDYKIKHEQIFCGDTTDVANPAGTCKGDFGGGVVYDNKIYGVISGDHSRRLCTVPDKYMDVCGYMPWITRYTAIKPPK